MSDKPSCLLPTGCSELFVYSASRDVEGTAQYQECALTLLRRYALPRKAIMVPLTPCRQRRLF